MELISLRTMEEKINKDLEELVRDYIIENLLPDEIECKTEELMAIIENATCLAEVDMWFTENELYAGDMDDYPDLKEGAINWLRYMKNYYANSKDWQESYIDSIMNDEFIVWEVLYDMDLTKYYEYIDLK